MNNGDISVTQALNQIQSWLNAGEFEKVIQGCQEIMQIEPGNQRALTLLKQAEERKHRVQMKMPDPVPEPEPQPDQDPLAELKVEHDEEKAEPEPYKTDFHPEEKRKLFMAMIIPAILVVVIGGGGIWYLSNNDREEMIETAVINAEPEMVYTEANENRLADITAMSKVLETYKNLNGAFPSLKQVEEVFLQSDEFNEVPRDARHGEFDKAGKMYGYLYAVYDGAEGENTIYIISALFEDSKGFGYAWTRGASTKNYDGYRDLNNEHVVFIGGNKEGIKDEKDSEPKVKVKREA